MNYLVFDTENTGAQRNHAHPFDPANRCCCVSFVYRDLYPEKSATGCLDIEYKKGRFFEEHRDEVQAMVDASEWIVGFNLKYDLHWLDRIDVKWRGKKLWDCQLIHFYMLNQTTPYPALNDVLDYHKLERKIDVVAVEYWDKGLDTDQVPWDILSEYAEWDAGRTEEVFKKQCEWMKYIREHNHNLYVTIRIAMEDQEVICDMESNGIKFNVERSLKLAEKSSATVARYVEELDSCIEREDMPHPSQFRVNWGSSQQVSTVLFGGTLKYSYKEDYVFRYKDPKREPAIKQRHATGTIDFPRIVNPAPKAKETASGFLSVSETDLRLAKPIGKLGKHMITTLLALSKEEKLLGTYYEGFPKRMGRYGWTDVIHSSLNQCVTKTTRLSSTNPNLQNVPPVFKCCFVSRYPVRRTNAIS